jgi:hypothetical protein
MREETYCDYISTAGEYPTVGSMVNKRGKFVGKRFPMRQIEALLIASCRALPPKIVDLACFLLPGQSGSSFRNA